MGRKVLPPFLELALRPSSPLPLSRAGESLKGRLRRVHGSALNVICRGEITVANCGTEFATDGRAQTASVICLQTTHAIDCFVSNRLNRSQFATSRRIDVVFQMGPT